MTADLKPCPWCGGDDMTILHGPAEDDWCAVSCDQCQARGPSNYTDPHAIAAWNTRADLAPAAIREAALREALTAVLFAYYHDERDEVVAHDAILALIQKEPTE